MVTSVPSQKGLMTSSPLSKERGSRHPKAYFFKNVWGEDTGKHHEDHQDRNRIGWPRIYCSLYYYNKSFVGFGFCLFGSF